MNFQHNHSRSYLFHVLPPSHEFLQQFLQQFNMASKKRNKNIRMRRFANQVSLRSAYRLPSAMRSIGRHTRAYQTQDLFDTYDDSDPFLFHQRIVLRSQGLIPLKKLVKLHRLHKEVTRIASHHWAIMLGVMNRHIPSDPCDDPDTPSKLLPDELRARVRVMERTFHEQ